MLIQSQMGAIQLLPALPDQWANGQVKGLKTRGDFEVTNLESRDGKVVKFAIKSLTGAYCTLLSPNALKAAFKYSKQETAKNFKYNFKTQLANTYTFTAL